ncbi:MAG: AI-2E family transporter, partial [Lachnospiraceae bacterium]|nr:AI-2E family transporter [Lachnospiraceae bacterium]
KMPEKYNNIKRTIGIVLSILFFVAVIAFVVITVIPQVGRTLNQLTQKIPVFFNNAFAQAEILLADNPQALEFVNNLEYESMDWNGIFDKGVGFVKNGVGSLLTSTVSVAGNLFGSIVNGVIAFISSIYILSQKEKLKDQARRVVTAYFKETTQKKIFYVWNLIYHNFSKFLTGQCIEAVILGALFVVAMSIFKMPYAFMIGVLIAFTALIPLVGAFIGCFVGAFFILVDTPIKALWFVVMFLIIQQLEGNLIYPKVVGNSVGLPSLWVLVAVTLGSSMFGVVGMLMFIPLFSTVYTLLREDVNKRNKKAVKEKKE